MWWWWSSRVFTSYSALLIVAHAAASLEDAINPSPEYGPPGPALSGKEPDAVYGPPMMMVGGSLESLETMYGPPGFTPGEPLDVYAASASFQLAESLVAPECNNWDLATNKQLVLDFYQNVFGDKRIDLLDRYVDERVTIHNPEEVDGRDSIRELLKGPVGQGPKSKVDFQRVSAEGDLVWLHTRLPIPALNATFAVVDIFRVNCAGKIQEIWDVVQDTAIPHPFF